MSDGKTSIYTGLSYREDVSSLHVALENGSDLHVNERRALNRDSICAQKRAKYIYALGETKLDVKDMYEKEI